MPPHTRRRGRAPRRGQPGVKSSNREPLSSPKCTRATTTHHIHHKTTPTNTRDRSICRFGDMCRSAQCPLVPPKSHRDHLTATTGGKQRPPPPPRQRTLAAVSAPAEQKRAPNWEEHTQKSNWAQGRPTHSTEMSPNRIGLTTMHRETMRCERYSHNNHQMRCTPSKPSANKPPPPLPLQGARKLHKGGGCAPRAGRCPPWGWQQGRDEPTRHGTINVMQRREIHVQGGGGQAGGAGMRAQKGHPGAPTDRGRSNIGRGGHTKRDEGRQEGGAQQGRRGNQKREPEWSGWESVRMGGSNNKGWPGQPALSPRVPGQPLLNRHQVGGVSCSLGGLSEQQERGPTRGRRT